MRFSRLRSTKTAVFAIILMIVSASYSAYRRRLQRLRSNPRLRRMPGQPLVIGGPSQEMYGLR